MIFIVPIIATRIVVKTFPIKAVFLEVIDFIFPTYLNIPILIAHARKIMIVPITEIKAVLIPPIFR